MSRARDFLLAKGKPYHVRHPAPAADDGGGVLYGELLKALRARGVSAWRRTCRMCQGQVLIDLLEYPEIRMACTDAVQSFCEIVAAEVAKREGGQ